MAKINIEDVPEFSLNDMARKILGGIDGFYADPENRKRIEEREKKREEEKH